MGGTETPYRHLTSSTQLRTPDPCGHAVQFYEKNSALIHELCAFVDTALCGGDAVIVVATEAHRKALADRLEAKGFDLRIAASQGRYIALDAGNTLSKFMREDHVDKVRFIQVMIPIIKRAKEAADGKEQRVAIFGEMVALLWSVGKPAAAIALEGLWNDLAQMHDFSLLCAYPMSAFAHEGDSIPLLEICRAHSRVIPCESFTSLSTDEERSRTIVKMQQKEQVHEELRKVKKELQTEIAERTMIERKLRDSEHSLRELSGCLLRVQEEERQQIGKGLHEGIGQYLVALKIVLDLLEPAARTFGPTAACQIEDGLELIDTALTAVQTMSHVLYPPMLEEFGLSMAIPWCLDGFGARSGIETTLDMPEGFGRLPREVELAIFRVLQEGLINAYRCDACSSVRVKLLVSSGTARIEVGSSGTGIGSRMLQPEWERSAMGVSLPGLMERLKQLGGNLEVASSLDGATLVATLPYQGSAPHGAQASSPGS